MVLPFLVYIDPGIKGLDKELYNNIERKIMSIGGVHISDIKELELNSRPALLFIHDSKPPKFSQEERPFDFIFKFKEQNLNLFDIDDNPVDKDVLFIQDTKEFLDLWEQSSFLLSQVFELYIDSKVESSSLTKKNQGDKLELAQEQTVLTQIFNYLIKERPTNSAELNQIFSLEPFENYNIKFIPFPEEEGKELALVKLSMHEFGDIKCSYGHLRYQMYQILTFFYSLQRKLEVSKLDWEKKKDILDGVSFPLAIIEKEEEVLFSNRSFSQVAPQKKELKKLRQGQFYHYENDIYKVFNTSLYDDIALVTLNTSSFDEGGNPTSEELGIISSSIAHELNNPLGAILAAIDVLLLDDFESEISDHLVEMKKVVIRCKKLVETFLGFSRSNVHSIKLSKNDFSLEDSFNQAAELIRFRLIETNTHIDFLYIRNHKFQYTINPYIVTMIYYLFLGEILTSYSHFCLLDNRDSGHFELQGLEHGDRVEILFPSYLKLNQQVFKSRLIQHLIEGEKLTLSVETGKIILKV